MTTTITVIFYSIIGKMISLGFFSFIVNSFLLILIEKKVFGSKIKNLVEEISKSKKNAIFIWINYFVFVYILIFIVKYNINIIYLDTVKVDVTINGVDASITGEFLAAAKEICGDTAVFLGSARLAYLIISKNSALSSFSKIGIVLASGGGGLTSYRVIDRSLNYIGVERNEVVLNGNLKLDSVNVITSGNYKIPDHPVLDLLFGMNKGFNYNNAHQQFKVITNNEGTTILKGTDTTGIINALDNHNPNWKSQFYNNVPSGNSLNPFISSPYENEASLISFLIENLTDHFYLSIITIYLLLMLLLIFICKLILNSDIGFTKLSKIKIFKWNLGEKIAKLLTLFISIWTKSSSFWIFLIIIMLIIFNGVSLFSIFTMLKILKNIS